MSAFNCNSRWCEVNYSRAPWGCCAANFEVKVSNNHVSKQHTAVSIPTYERLAAFGNPSECQSEIGRLLFVTLQALTRQIW